MTATVHAKVNLSLAITGKKNGLHTLDMIVCPYEELWDTVEFFPRDTQDISVRFAEGAFKELDEERFARSLAPKLGAAARQLGVYGEFLITKNIPLGGGIGGSSAPIAGAIKSMRHFSSAPISNEFLLSLGSDVPAMYTGGTLRVRGTGEILTPLKTPKGLKINLVFTGSVDSGECYKLYDALTDGTERPDAPIPATAEEALRLLRNDLELPAAILDPEAGELLRRLRGEGKRALLSGSGGTVAIFET